jgi:O-6-methylguanine DNA methyltransferase
MMAVMIETADGAFSAWFSAKGLAALFFPTGRSEPRSVAQVPVAWQRQTAEALQAVLRGEQPKQLPPFDLSRGTSFQKKVWKALLTIRAGKTCSYGEVAAMIGMPGAARAVGAACGSNRIPVLIPCHRVLAANHRIGGFSAGLKWKRLLLEREGVTLEASKWRPSLGLAEQRWRRNRQLTVRKRPAEELNQRFLDGLE